VAVFFGERTQLKKSLSNGGGKTQHSEHVKDRKGTEPVDMDYQRAVQAIITLDHCKKK